MTLILIINSMTLKLDGDLDILRMHIAPKMKLLGYYIRNR